LTLPITVAAAERSFSKLKIIKNYLRGTIAAFGLLIISIENSFRGSLGLWTNWLK